MAKKGMVEVSTTMRPDKKIEVTTLEAESLRRKGILKTGAQALASEQKKEGQ